VSAFHRHKPEWALRRVDAVRFNLQTVVGELIEADDFVLVSDLKKSGDQQSENNQPSGGRGIKRGRSAFEERPGEEKEINDEEGKRPVDPVVNAAGHKFMKAEGKDEDQDAEHENEFLFFFAGHCAFGEHAGKKCCAD